MREALPNAAIIAILRDPVARAFSHYQHQRTRRREGRTFDEIVAASIRGPPAEGPESAMEIKYVAMATTPGIWKRCFKSIRASKC